MRYAWDLQHQYLKESGLNRGLKGFFTRYMLHKMRLWDMRTANGVDHFISNSQFIAKRIWKVYRREATVIYPPIDTQQFSPYSSKENYYLAASRLVPYKKMDLIVEAFAHLPNKKLVVIGDGPDMNKIKAKAGKNVEILGYQSTKKLIHYMQRAKALIFAAEEDFGMIPLEAQACGTPVIAYGKGGSLETVRSFPHPHPTGLFFSEQTVSSLLQAINTFETCSHQLTFENCVQHAAQFAPLIFRDTFKHFIMNKMDLFKNNVKE
jgi:glycosyltransferase involved in cell wall biosynthesis